MAAGSFADDRTRTHVRCWSSSSIGLSIFSLTSSVVWAHSIGVPIPTKSSSTSRRRSRRKVYFSTIPSISKDCTDLLVGRLLRVGFVKLDSKNFRLFQIVESRVRVSWRGSLLRCALTIQLRCRRHAPNHMFDCTNYKRMPSAARQLTGST